ncbi:MAG: hypothetical protein M1835_003884, partial [Candelina submexicana]
MSLIQRNLQNVRSMFTPAQMSVILGGPQHQSKKKRPVTEKVMKKKPTIVVPIVAKSNTRPLNSFIAFRSYYSPLFLTLPQKNISGFLTYLWQHDVFQAKWAILAKAYSMIRDTKGKANTPLDDFLTINAPFIGIIDPKDYLAMMGWEITLNNQGHLNLIRLFVPDISAFDEHFRTTNLSVQEIIQHSCDQGYLPKDDGQLKMIGQMPAEQHLMASGAQPTPTNSSESIHSNAGLGEQQDELLEHSGDVDGTATQAPAVPWWQNTLDEFNAAGEQEFPFNNQFNPDIETNLLFDPFE